MKTVRIFLFFFAITLPLNTLISNAFLILFFVFSSVYIIKYKQGSSVIKLKEKLTFSLLPLFLLLFFGLLSTKYLDDSFRFFEKSISLFLAPVILLYFDFSQLKKLKDVFIKGLFVGTTTSLTILLYLLFYNYFEAKQGIILQKDILNYYHTHVNFTKPLDIHPTYLGIYYVTTLVFYKEVGIKKSYFGLWCTLLLIALIFINSRVIFLVVSIYGCIRFFNFLKNAYIVKNNLKILFSLLLLIIGFTVLIKVLSKTYIAHRLNNTFEFELSYDKEVFADRRNKGNPRLIRWHSAIKLIQEKPLIGHGIADEYKMLNKQFRKDDLKFAIDSNYNAHNQFLGYGIRFGILGILVLINFFVQNISRSIALKNLENTMIFTSVLLVCLFENFFDRNYGITFSAIFLSLISFIMVQEKLKSQKS